MVFRQILAAPLRVLASGSNNTSRIHVTQSIRPLTTSQILKSKDRPKTTEGLSPKILNENPPKDEEQSDDVKKHNKEMSEMSGKANAQIKNEDAHKDKESPEKGQDKVKKDQKH